MKSIQREEPCAPLFFTVGWVVVYIVRVSSLIPDLINELQQPYQKYKTLIISNITNFDLKFMFDYEQHVNVFDV